MLESFFAVREGIPVATALEQASCFLASAKAELNALGNGGNIELSYSAGCLIELAKALVDSAVEVIEFPAAAADSNVGGSKAHSLAVDLTGELIFLNDYLELASDRANNDQSDGRLVALFAAAMPRMKRALELSNELEVSHA